MKCICGYEKMGYGHKNVPEQKILYETGPKKGKLKKIIPRSVTYEDLDPQNPEFIKIQIEKEFKFIKDEGGFYPYPYPSTVEIYACPKCGTLKIEI